MISMAVSPSASAKLYRKRWAGVILLTLALVQIAAAQTKPPVKKPKGPRALALMELGPNGAAHLIPVAILVDGEFYDAGAYKAAPIPMALESGTVYEAERTGTSLGLFTVTGALEGPDNTWSGAGRFVPAGSKPPANAHKADSKPRDLEDTDSRPVLRRRAEKPTPAEAAPPAPSASAPPASASPAPASPAPSAPTPSAPATATPAPSAATPPSPPADATTAAPTVTAEAAASDENDPDRPTLKRGKPTAASKKVTPSATTAPAKTPSKTSPSATPRRKAPQTACSSFLQFLMRQVPSRTLTLIR